MASNKLKLSKREYVKWAEFFEWEHEQRTKQETYLARLIYLAERQVYKEPAEMKDCFCPPLTEKETICENSDEQDDGILDPESGWLALEAVFKVKE